MNQPPQATVPTTRTDRAAAEGEHDTSSGEHVPQHGPLAALHRLRERIRARPSLNVGYRVAIGVLGGVVLIVGLVLIPYPGPGWLVVFAGLGILATEFHWARRVNAFAKHQYQRWTEWLRRQPLMIKLAVMAVTGLVVVATLWLLNAYAMIGGWFGIHWPWLASPLFAP